MGFVRICERCGKKIQKDSEARHILISKLYAIKSEYAGDLCPDCVKELNEFLGREKNNEK